MCKLCQRFIKLFDLPRWLICAAIHLFLSLFFSLQCCTQVNLLDISSTCRFYIKLFCLSNCFIVQCRNASIFLRWVFVESEIHRFESSTLCPIAVRLNNMDPYKISLNTPALKPPDGVISNFDHPDNKNSEIYATLILSVIVSTLMVWTRLYTKYFIIKAHGWEDCTLDVILSVLSAIFLS